MSQRKTGEPLTERECKKLHKLLGKFRDATEDAGQTDWFNPGERLVIDVVMKWLRWYANETISVDL